MSEIKELNLDNLKDFYNIDHKFLNHIGASVTHIEKGSATVELEITDKVYNPIGSVHGGATFSIADVAGGVAAVTYGDKCTTVNSVINYLKPALKGKVTKLRAISSPIKVGKKLRVFNIDIKDQDDNLIAQGTFTYMSLGSWELKG